MFVTPRLDLDELQGRVQHELDALRNVQDMLGRCQLCVKRGREHVEGVGA